MCILNRVHTRPNGRPDYAQQWPNTHWHVRELGLEVGQVEELGKLPSWVTAPASEHLLQAWGLIELGKIAPMAG